MSVTILAGYSAAAVASCNALFPARSVIVVEHPDIVDQRDLRNAVADSAAVADLVAWDHTAEGAADAFAASLGPIQVASVVPITDYATVFAARLAERLHVPTVTSAAARILRNKHVLRHVTNAHGIPNPTSHVVSDADELQQIASGLGLPVVVKPSGRQASVGTTIVTRLEDLPAAFQAANDSGEGMYAPKTVAESKVLVEEYVDGPEYSVEALIKAGAVVFFNVTEKILAPGNRPVEAGHVVPARVNDEFANRLVHLTQAVVDAVGFGTGIVHCEWKIGGADRSPRLIECAGRFAGDGIIELIERAYGFDIVAAFHQLMRGAPVGPLPVRATRGAAVRFITPVQTWGQVTDVNVDEEALAKNGTVLHWHVLTKPGDHVDAVTSSWDRCGGVTVLAADADAAADNATQAIQSIQIVTESGAVPCQ